MFRNAKVGDRVWDMLRGWGTVEQIDFDVYFPIRVVFDESKCDEAFTLEGKLRKKDINPTLFWNEIRFEIPEKPFNLKKFLRENLEPKEFKRGENNYSLYWNENTENIGYLYSNFGEYMQPYFTIKNIQEVVNTLNENKITFSELKQTFKELGWI